VIAMTELQFSRRDLVSSDGLGIFGVTSRLANAVRTTISSIHGRWRAAAQFRGELEFVASLPDRELADMGFTRHDVDRSRRLGYWVRAADEE
jgi:uncharacterized protein YjiS (DUF1127 family)